MHVLIVDDDMEFQALARQRIVHGLPGAQVSIYDPDLRGPPEPHFLWARYDCVLLDQDLGASGDGLAWLESLGPVTALPPVILLTGPGAGAVESDARRLGVEDYLRKQDASGMHLAILVREVVERRRHARVEDASVLTMPRLDDDGLPPDDGTDAGDLPEFEDYRVHALVGEGATSRVYLGERGSDGRTVVLKVLSGRHARDRKQIRRFMREADLITRARSAYVVEVYEQHTTPDGGFIAMEFLPRGDLRQRIARGLSSVDAVNCLRNIAYALDAVHGAGIVHRDLKPGNLMFRHDDTLVLADFGLSREIDVSAAITAHGQVMGTPAYMSPEQCDGRTADARSDLYGAGVIFHEMLTGRCMYDAETILGLMHQHLDAPLPRLPRRFAPYQTLLNRLVAKDPVDRFQSARALIEALDGMR